MRTSLTCVLVVSSAIVSLTSAARQTSSVGDATLLPFPYFDGAHAIWGATGQDARGHLWFGITTGGITPSSAHLVEYIAESGRFTDRGNVLAELQRAGVARAGEQQAKIHSKIVPGPDNSLYFASMDEEGEKADGSAFPTWGAHLWRMSLTTYRWQHLLQTKEALIAVGGAGQFIYALGYFGHVLYQYDSQTGRTARLEVGSVDGHISRNFLVDHRAHVFVPRLVERAAATVTDPRQIEVSLVEFDTALKEVRRTPLDPPHYLEDHNPTGSHGIVGLQEMADGTIYFTTHAGFLYRVVPPARTSTGSAREIPAAVSAVGWIHPDGRSYPPSLFTSDGRTTIASAAERPGGPWEWITCDVPVTLPCRSVPLRMPVAEHPRLGRVLLYGSSTRDAAGGHYLVGIASDYRPAILRVQGR